ncbi:hypothetical protein REPUB_Repub19eG0000100 [Reevesia pubescens]
MSLLKQVRKIGKVARAIVIMSHPIPNTNDSHSVQIILSQKHLGHKLDIWIGGDKAGRQLEEANISQKCFLILLDCATKKLLEVVATYNFLLEVAMKIQHVQQTWKWLVDGFASYYGVSDAYTKLRYGDAIGSFKLLSFVQFSFQVQIPFLCHGYGYTEDCLTLIYDLLSPVKGNSKHKSSHQKVDVLFELIKGLIKDMDGADVDEISLFFSLLRIFPIRFNACSLPI